MVVVVMEVDITARLIAAVLPIVYKNMQLPYVNQADLASKHDQTPTIMYIILDWDISRFKSARSYQHFKKNI
jgi:hypothetical protein